MNNDLKLVLNQLQKSEIEFQDIQRQLLSRNKEILLSKGNSKRTMTFWFQAIMAVLLVSVIISFVHFHDTNLWNIKNEIEVKDIIPSIGRAESFPGDKLEVNEDEKILPCLPRLETESPLSQNDQIDDADDENVAPAEKSIRSDGQDHILTTDSFLKDRMRLEYMQNMRVGQFYHRAYCE